MSKNFGGGDVRSTIKGGGQVETWLELVIEGALPVGASSVLTFCRGMDAFASSFENKSWYIQEAEVRIATLQTSKSRVF